MIYQYDGAFVCTQWPCLIPRFPSQAWHLGCSLFWIQQDHAINISKLSLATILEYVKMFVGSCDVIRVIAHMN